MLLELRAAQSHSCRTSMQFWGGQLHDLWISIRARGIWLRTSIIDMWSNANTCTIWADLDNAALRLLSSQLQLHGEEGVRPVHLRSPCPLPA